jgi:hypothetical protein
MKKISLNAVLAGGIADLLVTNLLSIPFIAFVVVNAGLARLPKEQVQAALMSTIHANGALHAMQLLLGLIATGIGGYVAAWIAKRDAVLHGALASWTCVALGIYSILSGENSTPAAMTLGLMFASVVCAAFGGYLRHPADPRTRIPV